ADRPGKLVESSEQLAAILVAHVGVVNCSGKVEQATPEPGFPLRRGQWIGIAFMTPESLDQRFGAFDQRLESRTALGAEQIIGVLAGGKGDEGQAAARADMRQRPKRGARRGLL